MISWLVAGLMGLQSGPALVIRGGMVYDGLGHAPIKADVRIVDDKIEAVGRVEIHPGDQVIQARGMAVCPGFIDAHSHADGGVFEDPNAETHIRQGITTSLVGEDGGSALPLRDFFDNLQKTPVALNFASFIGMGSVREKVMGMAERAPTGSELDQLKALVAQGMADGALGLSTGLEYEPNRYAKTDEVIELAKVAQVNGGSYISHIRNEDNHAFEAFTELIKIAKEAHLPGEINHIKLGSQRVWGRAGEVIGMMEKANSQGESITADVYPYTFWQSTIKVIIETEQFDDRKQWEKGLADIGGAGHVLMTEFTPDPTWAGKTLEELAKKTGKDPISLAQEIIKRTKDVPGAREGVVVTAMSEADLEKFIACPLICFCSDGGLDPTHPRGAGSFPRILGLYVRQKHTLSLTEAIRKMTSLPAQRFHLGNRGVIAKGYQADVVVFDPRRVIDTATTAQPKSAPKGIPDVIVNGTPVLLDGKFTGAHPGRPIRHAVPSP